MHKIMYACEWMCGYAGICVSNIFITENLQQNYREFLIHVTGSSFSQTLIATSVLFNSNSAQYNTETEILKNSKSVLGI